MNLIENQQWDETMQDLDEKNWECEGQTKMFVDCCRFQEVERIVVSLNGLACRYFLKRELQTLKH